MKSLRVRQRKWEKVSNKERRKMKEGFVFLPGERIETFL